MSQYIVCNEVVSVMGQKRAGKVLAVSGLQLLLGWWMLEGRGDLTFGLRGGRMSTAGPQEREEGKETGSAGA